MPLALLAALAGSLALHVAALLGPDLDLSGPSEPPPLNVELKAPPPEPPPPPVRKAPRHKPVATRPAAAPASDVPADASAEAAADPQAASAVDAENAPESASTVRPEPPPAPAAKPVLAGSGSIRYTVVKGSLGLVIGRVEQRWEFNEDGSYRLTGLTETTGLAALIRPTRIEQESRGRLVAGGLQPDTFRVRKNGADANENADFDWSTVQVVLSRDGQPRPIARGTQDLLSLNFQLAYFGRLGDGVSVGVVTGKKYERYALDSLGEEELETPAGRFRTLHLRAQGDTVSEFWVALDERRLVVRVRFTDNRGDSFEQTVSELGGR